MSQCPIRISLTFKAWSQAVDRDISYLETFRSFAAYLSQKLFDENKDAFLAYYTDILLYGATTLTLAGDPRELEDKQ